MKIFQICSKMRQCHSQLLHRSNFRSSDILWRPFYRQSHSFDGNNTFSPYLVQNEVFREPGKIDSDAVNKKFFRDKEQLYKVAIFDKDGTLVCFHAMWTPWAKKLNKKLCAASGLDISQNIWTVLGVCSKTFKTGPGILAEGTKSQIQSALIQLLMQKGLTELKATELVSANLEECNTSGEYLQQLHDLRQLFTVLREHDVRVAVVTADTRLSTTNALRNLNILHLVDIMICGDDAHGQPKPSPHNAHIICRELQVKPKEMVMIGDTKTDMLFGKNAELGGRIGVLSGVGQEQDLRDHGADEIIASVEDILPLLLPNRPIQLTERARRVHESTWKLAIFDKDGTLTDIHFRWSKWAVEVGKKLTSLVGKEVASQFYKVIGVCEDSTRIIKGLLAEATTLHLRESLYHLLLINGFPLEETQHILQQVWVDPSEFPDKVVEGVVETFEILQSRGIKVAINTSDNRQCTDRFLSQIQVQSLVDYVITATESHPFPKPLPQSTLQICKELAVNPEEAVMIGDSRTDLLSCRAARLGASVGVMSGVSTPENIYAYADVLIPNVTYTSQLLSRGPFGTSPPRNDNSNNGLSKTSFLQPKRSYSQSATSSMHFSQHSSKPTITEEQLEFDYVIVGAGSAGCVLANRLSAPQQSATTQTHEVCLIEAGGKDDSWTISMPAALMYNLCHDKYNWYYHTLPEPHMNQRVMYWPRGRVWGGSSSLNAMCYVRGHPSDYNRWVEEGAQGWSYFQCLPYFRRAQSHSLGSNDYRGDSGPLHVSRGVSQHPLHRVWIEAGQEAGFPFTEDMNGFQQEGVGEMDLTIGGGMRSSTSTAYLRPVLYRPNLTTLTNALVTRVLFQDNNAQRASGIEIIKHDCIQRIVARKEVILCGGAINSPQLLMLSGIGNSDELKQIGIPHIHQHLPGVGANLQDHLEVYVQQECKQPITLYSAQWKFPINMIRIGWEYFFSLKGWGATSHLESGGFVRSEAGVPHPDIQYHFLPSTVYDHGRQAGSCHAYQVHAGSMRSQSRGKIWLASTDPRAHPLIQANYMSEERDFFEMRQSIQLAREIFAQKAFDPYRGKEILPGLECQSDAALNAFIRAHGDSAYHPSGTCRMGSESQPKTTVVDSQCRVLGIEGLRVVDASIMPSIVSGNLNAPTIMIAEKAADIILNKPPLEAKTVPIWTPQNPHKQRDALPERGLSQ